MKVLKRGAVVIAVMALLLGMGVALPSLAQSGRGKSDDHRKVMDLSSLRRGDDDHDERDKRDDDDDHDDEDEDGERAGHSRRDAMSNLSWSGTLCDGQPVTIDFSLYDDEVKVENVSGPASRIEDSKRGVRVHFDGLGARVSLRSERGGDSQVRLDARRGSCGNTTTTVGPPPAAAAPTPSTAAPTTAPPVTTPGVTQPPTTPAPTQPPTTPAPTVTTQPPTTVPAKQVRYLTYTINGQGTITIVSDEPSNRIKFHAFTPNGTACWYTYDGKSLGSKIKTTFSDQTSFEANVGASGVAATYNGATIAPSGNTTVAPASTKSSC